MTDAAGGDEDFLTDLRRRLEPAFLAAFGAERGSEALAEALGYAWEQRDRVRRMDFPAAYLYRVGQSRTRWIFKRRPVVFPPPQRLGDPEIEPGLIPGLRALSEKQRVCVVLVHAYDWTHAEVAELLGIGRTTVQTHVERGLDHLRESIGVHDEQ